MSERLYYSDPGLLTFRGKIVDTGRSGERYYTILDQTAFYPTSGGQSHDTGMLGTAAIIDVVEDIDGLIRHVSEEPVGQPGEEIEGRINEARRTRNRHLHTAQHLLSAAAFKVLGSTTMSVHLGEKYGAVELDLEEMTTAQLNDIEEHANRCVAANVPIEVHFVPYDDLDKFNLRKPSAREGILRIIKMGEFDQSACGGTHCDRTGDVGFIKVVGLEKMRQRSLLKFLAGRLLFEDYKARFEVTDYLIRQMTCAVEDVPAKFDRLLQSEKEKGHTITTLQKELIPIRIAEAASEKQLIGEARTVVKDMPDLDPSIANRFVAELAGSIEGVAAIRVSGRLIVGSALPGVDASAVVRGLAQRFKLRGGGSPQMAQVGGTDEIDWNECRNAIKEILS